MNTNLLLERLEEICERGLHLPLTGKVLVDEDDILDIVDQLRANLPEEMRRAEWISKEKERLLEEGRAEAEKMVSQAEEYVQRLIAESEIVKQAERAAKELMQKARADAQRIQEGAASYGRETLARLEEQLEKILHTVRRGQEQLSQYAEGKEE